MANFIKLETEFIFLEKGEKKIHYHSRYINLDQVRTVKYNHSENTTYIYYLDGSKEILKDKIAEAFDKELTKRLANYKYKF